MTIFHRVLCALALTLSATFPAWGDNARAEILATPEKAGGVYYAYPGPADSQVKAPRGYEPFYISHYGRHGSRYLISDDDYIRIIRLFEVADSMGYLTSEGLRVKEKLAKVWKEAEGRGGELTPLGARQHKGIARRMFESYPEVFCDSAVITARSTQVMRCAHSMMAFCEGLKEMNPALEIPKESSRRWMDHLCWWTPEAAEWNSDRGPWKQTYDEFECRNIDPQPFVMRLMQSSEGLPLTPAEIMWGLYWVAVDVQNAETQEDFFEYFTNEELYRLWRVNNLSFYMHNAEYPMSEGLITANARNLLDNIITTADEYLADGSTGATLRFGHDGNITPLAALMRLDGFCGQESDPEKVEDAWATFRITPMASNFQMIFFRPKDDNSPVLVKFMMNEHDVLLPSEIATVDGTFYDWETARAFLLSRVDDASSIIRQARINATAYLYKNADR